MISLRGMQSLLFTTAKRSAATNTMKTTESSSWRPLVSPSRRSLMTPTIEPPPNVTESPLSMILAEDEGFYSSSWHDTFAAQVPEQHGMGYRMFSLAADTANFDAALQEMKNEISLEGPNSVLVTRGPWMSWMASFYLESLPLAGLVMVDPMQLDDMNGINQFVLQYEKLGLQDSLQYKLYREYAEHWDHWTLKLEPGAVPMLVMYTNVRPGYKRCAENSALRHGEVPVLKMPSTSRNHVDDCIGEVVRWVHDTVV
uniref:Uncharacterized protein n=1 Tax=Amphora coffeiformis TaxID=265554 RepID=A0A7S3L4Q7_9STRA|mmetsp:Transcript_21218/g.40242  ORF Transcript_21218/g.40242 Transcript_21218/m.40242 type:complete len:256 (+) Transcript_21218:109-876(+)